MKVLLTTVDLEGEEHGELEDAIASAARAGASTTVVIEGFIYIAKQRKYDVAIIDHVDEGNCPRMWEQHCDTNIVVFPDRAEMRYYEMLELGGTKYMTHTETFPALAGALDEERFLVGLYRALAVDPVDLRKAVRMGMKLGGVISSPSVVE